MNDLLVFSELDELRRSSTAARAAVQAGACGGLWYRDPLPGDDNGGTCIVTAGGATWRRICDPTRLDPRWFGVRADGLHDDAPALQRTIDALPPGGGKILLPGGRMRCSRGLRIDRSFVTIEGVNCGELSRHFEPQHVVGCGSLLAFDADCDGIVISPPPKTPTTSRLGGVTLRDLGIAGTGRANGRRGICVQPGEGWGVFGSTDALLLERLYVIDYEWCAELRGADASIVSNCWLCECGNGLKLVESIYTAVGQCVVADNDGLGIAIEGGRTTDIVAGYFVRNRHALVASRTTRLKVLGGSMETDPYGGPRSDGEFIRLTDVQQTVVSATSFSATGCALGAAISVSGDLAGLRAVDCTFSGVIEPVAARGVD